MDTVISFQGSTLALSQVIGLGPLSAVTTDLQVQYQFRIYFRQYSDLVASNKFYRALVQDRIDTEAVKELEKFKADYKVFAEAIVEHLKTAVI